MSRRTIWVETTNTLNVPYLTGFQRHTRELLARLPGPEDDHDLAFVPVTWCQECDSFRRLGEHEAHRLREFRPTPVRTESRLSQLAAPLPPRARAVAQRAVHQRPVQALRDRVAAARRRAAHPDDHDRLRVDGSRPDTWLFDLEAAWHNLPTRDVLLPRLRAEGVHPSTLVADVMPELYPQWFDAGQIRLFQRFIRAHLRHSTRFVCISECSRRDLLTLADSLGIDVPTDTPVITMGADFRPAAGHLPRPASAPPGRYVLSVATIEPRKNHATLLDAFDQLLAGGRDVSLVFVGKAGWKTEALIDRMTHHPEFGGRFVWLDRVDDDELDALYRHAFVACQPSFYEGFGTPVIEALGHGVPTLSSSDGAQPEAGGEWAEYFDPHDTDALVDLLARHLDDPGHHAQIRERLSGYTPPTWDDGAAGIVDAFTRR